jgi:hypothetical protein
MYLNINGRKVKGVAWGMSFRMSNSAFIPSRLTFNFPLFDFLTLWQHCRIYQTIHNDAHKYM